MVKAGIGGVELSCVYPIAPKQPVAYGSQHFLDLVSYASRAAQARGMRFDMTIGSGWSFGGSHVTSEHAAKRLRFETRVVGPHSQTISLPGRWPGDCLIAAWISDGALGEHSPAFQRLELVGDSVSVPSGGSPRTILVATSGLTGQQLKRASNGAEGPTLDHYSREATMHHLESVGDPFLKAAGGSKNVTAVFCDSLEVYHSDWSPNMVQEFKIRRGYDPVPLLYHLWSPHPSGALFRADYYRTLSEVYEDNFLAVCHTWARQHGTKFRVQNYGQPPARISGFRHADMIEGESWGWLTVPQSRWAASAAHHLGINVVSSETWTWINSPSFKARPLDFKGEAHDHVLCGINHFIGHGWPSSPTNVVSPGWAFYASGAISDRNAWWKDASRPLFSYLHRLSEVMRHGEPVADIGIWMPYEDTYANFTHEEEHNLWRSSSMRLGEVPRLLRQAGYDYDLIDAGLDVAVICQRHKVVVLTGCTRLSKDDLEALANIASQGIKILAVDSDLLPSAIHLSASDLISKLRSIVPPDAHTGHPGIGAVHRRLADGELYFVANTLPTPSSVSLQTRTPHSSWQRWNIHDGLFESGTGPIHSQLAPYEAAIYVTSQKDGNESKGSTQSSGPSIPLERWSLEHPLHDLQEVFAPHQWDDSEDFVGSATYTSTIQLAAPLPSYLYLDTSKLPTPKRSARRDQSFEAHAADPLGVVAAVLINGQEAGTFWDPPYQLEIGRFLQTGANTIAIRVSNTSVPAMRSGDWRKIWEETERAHGRRFIMQEIDYAYEPTRSGLLVIPELRR
ncbi:hypothetical protein BD324DRAFT_648905 [Kockovaella imperatae]|uniref:Glycoside hydrolase n=1 Tax=Kockovaella imperatae TaxID=4999 RepID=A0A1Y1UQT5_9TREE|nr:hypothetical protein BD324DRAFT_648905 [Kockovaella imperatae]ORX40322.1 hypothetical protein BD324DRAFT_648905 [Kockovaella imperatae]